jgi:hypothetical protein
VILAKFEDDRENFLNDSENTNNLSASTCLTAANNFVFTKYKINFKAPRNFDSSEKDAF